MRLANCSGADLRGASLRHASMARVKFVGATLDGCGVFGASVWDVDLAGASQKGLVITPAGEPEITVDNLKVAQFIYLLLENQEIRDVIDTVGKKGVLLLGRFTGGRLAVLERLREELRLRGFLPMVFNFDKPETKNFTETVRLLAGLSSFVIADITNPRSAPLELQAVVPEYMIPFVTVLEGEKPFAMFQDLWMQYREWVFAPIAYATVDELVQGLDVLIKRAQARSAELVARKAEGYGSRACRTCLARPVSEAREHRGLPQEHYAYSGDSKPPPVS
jgi:Pentapeptide repeats (8 copies)